MVLFMKRYIALTLMFLFAFTLFAGCNDKTADGTGTSGSKDSAQRVVDFAKEGFRSSARAVTKKCRRLPQTFLKP